MNILILTYEVFNQGGNFIRSLSYAKALNKLGHHVTHVSANRKILTLSKSTHNCFTSIETFDFAPKKIRHDGLSPADILSRLTYLSAGKYDLIHGFGHRPSVSLVSLILREKLKIPYIADWSDLWGKDGIAEEREGLIGKLIGEFDSWTESFFYKRADGITVISQDLYSSAQALDFSKKKIFTLPVSCPQETLNENSTQNILRKKYHLPQKVKIIGYAGLTNYDAQYFSQMLVELFTRDKDVLLLFIGNITRTFWQEISSHGFAHRIIDLGFVSPSSLPEYLACCDVMCLPYTDKSINRARFPNKLGDYISVGRPIVSNPTGDLPKIFQENKIGLLAEDAVDFAHCIITLLKKPALAKQMGNNAYQAANSTFSQEKIAQKLIKYYYTILENYQ